MSGAVARPLLHCLVVVLTPDAIAELELYFGPAAASGPSPMGAMLERAASLYRQSNGEVVDVRRIVPVVRELASSSPSRPVLARVMSPWPYMRPRTASSAAERIEPEDQDDALQTTARVSRRMAQLPPDTRQLLALLYGDEGCRWAREIALGRVWALVPLTPHGQRALARDDAQRAEKGRPPAVLQPSERLAELARARPRPAWVDCALDRARDLQRTVEAIWGGADG